MIDLHTHSTVSDGKLTPCELVQLAANNGCQMLALTDHDHTGGIKAAQQAAQAHHIRLITGVEISVTWQKRGVHIVGLNIHPDDASLQNLLLATRSGRLSRLRAITDKLIARGLPDLYHDSLQLASNPEMVSRTHIAEALVKQGIVKNKQKAFDKYLGDHKVANVAHEWASLECAVSAIRGAGGIAVIAHPMRYPYSLKIKRQLIEAFIDLGGAGIEVHSGRGFTKDRTDYTKIAAQYGLLTSVGSDFHRLEDYTSGIVGAPYPNPLTLHNPVWAHF